VGHRAQRRVDCFLPDRRRHRALRSRPGRRRGLATRDRNLARWRLPYSQALIIAAERIYALGAFRTLSGDSLHLDVREDVKHLLAEWKKDMPKLLERFDLDGNSTLDLREGQLARAQARREVERNRRELRAAPDTHFLSRPADGRLFLISSLPPEKIERCYLLWAIASRGVLRRLVGRCALLVGGISWGSSALQPRCPRVIQLHSHR
jgi:hypothetical protein